MGRASAATLDPIEPEFDSTLPGMSTSPAASENVSDGPLLWSVAEVSRQTSWSKSAVHRLIEQGSLPTYKYEIDGKEGRSIRLKRSEVLAFVESCRMPLPECALAPEAPAVERPTRIVRPRVGRVPAPTRRGQGQSWREFEAARKAARLS